jgi:pyroglutamyl-peptidase
LRERQATPRPPSLVPERRAQSSRFAPHRGASADVVSIGYLSPSQAFGCRAPRELHVGYARDARGNTARPEADYVKALVTGFEPYGGRGINPAAELARAIDGAKVGAVQVAGACLPVSLEAAPLRLTALIEEHAPDIVLCLGLWPGEPMIRLERIALNRADFEIPDETGRLAHDLPLDPDGPDGLSATLPLHAILQALWAQGIPARLSGTAGTYLCNATMYALLNHARRRRPGLIGGFMHVPYLPAQVAMLLQELQQAEKLELHQRADLASMLKAVRIALVTCATARVRE